MRPIHLFLFFIGIVIGLSSCASSGKETKESVTNACTSSGHIDTYPDFHSQYVPSRTIRVWLPSGYTQDERYEVIYMHDGLMLFDSTTTWNHQEWGMDEAMDSLSSQGAIRPAIVVGIDNTPERICEYCPDDIALLLPSGHPIYPGLEARGNDYLRFIVEELKPFIDSVYSTYTDCAHTWTMGSSCGGLISSYALCRYPEVFGGAACLSTHCTLAYPSPDKPDSAVMAAYREYLRLHLPVNSKRIYMDQGDQTLDAYYSEAQAAINAMMQVQGWDEAHWMYRFYPGASHSENSWRARLDIPIRFLLSR